MDNHPISVVVSVVLDASKKVLITQRSHHKVGGGLWEFPGGKIESGETPGEAMVRELREEVGLEVSAYQLVDAFEDGVKAHSFLRSAQHCGYPEDDATDLRLPRFLSTSRNTYIKFYIYHVLAWTGYAHCREDQLAIEWVPWSSIRDYAFPPSNQTMIQIIEEAIDVTRSGG